MNKNDAAEVKTLKWPISKKCQHFPDLQYPSHRDISALQDFAQP